MQRRFLFSIRLLLAAVLAVASTAAAKLEGTSADKYLEHVKVLGRAGDEGPWRRLAGVGARRRVHRQTV